MADLRLALEGLLQALVHAGGAQEAAALRAELDARGWASADQADALRVMAVLDDRLGRATPAKTQVESAQPEQRAPGVVDGSRWRSRGQPRPHLEDYRPFLDAITDGERLVELLNELVHAREFDELVRRASALFVDTLGYEAHDLDALGRLTGKSTLQRFRAVARYDRFVVSVVELNAECIYTKVYLPVFRTYPYGLVLAWHPGRRSLRLVFRRVGGPRAGTVGYRTLRGPRYGRSPHDNLVVWARRLDTLRPRFEDDSASLRERAHVALEVEPADLALRWHSSAQGAQLEGISWNATPARDVASLLQLGVPAEQRAHWGLHGEFCNSFPFEVCGRSGRLDYLSYEVLELPAACAGAPARGPAEHWISPAAVGGRTLGVTLRLCLRACFENEQVAFDEPLELDCVLPLPDSAGRFLVDGSTRVFRPQRLPGGALVTPILDGDEEDLVEDYLATFEAPDGDNQAGEEEEQRTESSRGPRPRVLEGASLRTLLELLVGRKLRGMAAALHRCPRERITSPEALRRELLRWSDVGGRVRLAALQAFRAAAAPVAPEDETRPTRVVVEAQADVHAPPAWACPDVSSALPVGHWVPVAGARLHPTGDLAVPVARDGTTRLQVLTESALAANPRLQGPRGADDDPTRWIAEELRPWATTPPGTVQAPQHVCARVRPLAGSIDAVVTHGQRLGAALCVERLAALQAEPVVLVATVGGAPESDARPRLLVCEGTPVRPGHPWLEVPCTLWSGAGNDLRHRLEKVLATLLETTLPDPQGFHERIPAGVSGTVGRATLEPRWSKHRALIGWRATLLVHLDRRDVGTIVLPDGRLAPLAPLRTEDSPYRVDGGVPELVITDPLLPPEGAGPTAPGVDDVWFSGATGELCAVQPAHGPLHWLPPELSSGPRGPAEHLRFRQLDGAGIPGPYAPRLTELRRRWLRAVHPAVGAALDASEASWTAGVPPYWPRLLEVLRCAGTGPVPVGPAEWRHEDRARPESKGVHDPVRTRIRGLRTVYSERAALAAPIVWRCTCGALRGVQRAVEQCAACATKVTLRAQAAGQQPVPGVELPRAFLHPWRKDAAAGLLGLTAKELSELCTTCGGEELYPLIRAAQDQPLRSIRERLRSEKKRETQVALGRSLQAVVALTEQGQLDTIWLGHVPMPPPPLCPDGSPPGAPLLVHSLLTARHRRLRMALRHLRQIGECCSATLRAAAFTALQAALDELYGNDDVAAGYDSLAALAVRLWPPRRRAHSAGVVPGLMAAQDNGALVASSGEALFRAHAADCLRLPPLPEPPAEGDGIRPTLALATADRPLPLPDAETGSRAPMRASYWRERAAWNKLLIEHLTPLSGALLAIGDPASGVQLAQALLPQPFPSPQPEMVGRVVLREVLRGTQPPHGQPSLLLELLEPALPIVLPHAPGAALADVERRLRQACPGDAPERSFARAAFAQLLAGWWTCRVSEFRPAGWMWCALDQRPASGGARSIPPLGSAAWESLPSYLAVTNPVRWIALGCPGGDEPSPGLRALLGWDAPVPLETARSLGATESVPGSGVGVEAHPEPDPASETRSAAGGAPWLGPEDQNSRASGLEDQGGPAQGLATDPGMAAEGGGLPATLPAAAAAAAAVDRAQAQFAQNSAREEVTLFSGGLTAWLARSGVPGDSPGRHLRRAAEVASEDGPDETS